MAAGWATSSICMCVCMCAYASKIYTCREKPRVTFGIWIKALVPSKFVCGLTAELWMTRHSGG